MREQLKRFFGYTRAGFFSLALHSLIIALLFADLWWPFSTTPEVVKRVPTIKASAVSLEEVRKQQALIREQEERRLREIEEQKQRVAEAEQLAREQEEQRIQEAERQQVEQERREREQREQEEARKLAEAAEQERLAEERRLAEEQERKRKEEEARKKAEEEERKRKEEEERKKAEAERKRKEEEERKKAEAERKRKEEEARKKAEEERRQREEEVHKKAEEAEAAIRAFQSVAGLIGDHIEDNWRRPSPDVQGLQATIEFRVSINGEVQSPKVIVSSGDPEFDRSAEVAIRKASPLPHLPFLTNPKYYEYLKKITLEFNPDG